MKNFYFFAMLSGTIVYTTLLTGITNGQSTDTTYTSRSCKVYTIKYVDNLQAYTSPNLKKQEYFINTDYFKRYIDSKNQQLPNCPTNGGNVLNSYVDNSSNQNRFTAPNGKIYFISQQGGGYTADGLSNQKIFETIDELKNYIKTRNPLALLTISNNDTQTKQQTINENSNQQHGSADTQTQFNQNQNNQNQYSQTTQTQDTESNQTNTAQYGYCYGLPANAYRLNERFIQIRDGYALSPTSKAATYSQNSSTECSFVCIYNYTRNYDTKKCEPNENENEINQSLKDIKDLIDSESSNKNNSKICKSGYVKIDGECVKENRFKDCYSSDLPDNAKWVNGEFEQYRDGDSRYPTKVKGKYSKDDETECSFVCKSNYTRNSKKEVCERKSSGGGGGSSTSYSYSCNGNIPANATRNNYTSPSSNLEFFYDTDSSKPCSFQCNNNYSRNSSSNSCVANTKLTSCLGLPENSQWTNSYFIQTWNGSVRYPSTYNTTYSYDSSIQCSFHCNNNYSRNSSSNSCVANGGSSGGGGGGGNTTYSCKNLPNNASPNNSLTPSRDTDYFYNPNSQEACSFHCNTNYHRDSNSCADNSKEVACSGLPANAHWNVTNPKFTQTWINGDWSPIKTPVYSSDTSVPCSFICNTNYSRIESSNICKADTRTIDCPDLNSKYANAEWVNSKFTQTRNGTNRSPSSIDFSYNPDKDKKIECSFICEDEYTRLSNSYCGIEIFKCNGGLPDHATLNNENNIPKDHDHEYHYDDTSNSQEPCAYHCDEGYFYYDYQCRSSPRTGTCTNLPENAQWINSGFIQTRNGTEWIPSSIENTHGTNSEDIGNGSEGLPSSIENDNECSFMCKSGYIWNLNQGICEKPQDGEDLNFYIEVPLMYRRNEYCGTYSLPEFTRTCYGEDINYSGLDMLPFDLNVYTMFELDKITRDGGNCTATPENNNIKYSIHKIPANTYTFGPHCIYKPESTNPYPTPLGGERQDLPNWSYYRYIYTSLSSTGKVNDLEIEYEGKIYKIHLIDYFGAPAPIQYNISCTGNIPSNTKQINGDIIKIQYEQGGYKTEGLLNVEEAQNKLYEDEETASKYKCSYICKEGYTYKNGECEPIN